MAGSLLLSLLVGAGIGALVAALTELLLIRRLYKRHIEQVLVTVGLALATVALFDGIWGTDAIFVTGPGWFDETTSILGARVPNDRFVLIGVALLVLGGIVAFLRFTRFGLVIRAGVENRAMVTALGIDVRRAFTVVFAIGGAAAGLGGVLASHYFGYVSPQLGAVAADLRLHRHRHRRPGLPLRRGDRLRGGRGAAADAPTTTSPGPATWWSCCCWPPCSSCVPPA